MCGGAYRRALVECGQVGKGCAGEAALVCVFFENDARRSGLDAGADAGARVYASSLSRLVRLSTCELFLLHNNGRAARADSGTFAPRGARRWSAWARGRASAPEPAARHRGRTRVPTDWRAASGGALAPEPLKERQTEKKSVYI